MPSNPTTTPTSTPAGVDLHELLEHVTRVEAELDQVRQALAKTERLATLGEIAGLIAHEVNNLMTPIRSYAQMAIAKPGDTELSGKALRKAFEGADKAARVASAMLQLSGDPKFELLDEPAEIESADPQEAFEQALLCLARDPSKDRIELIEEVEGAAKVAMAPTALQQVLLNLILNARNAMPRGGTLTFRVGPNADGVDAQSENCGGDDGGGGGGCSTWNMVRLELADTGCGIAPDRITKVFESFETRGADGKSGGGSGLGLTVCKRLIERVGGTIEVVSVEGEGACFRLLLPVISRAA